MIAAAASGLWRSATALLNSARPETASFKTQEPPKPTRPTPPGEAGAPAEGRDKLLASLQSWLTVQQAQGTQTQGGNAAGGDMAKARAAYVGTAGIAG